MDKILVGKRITIIISIIVGILGCVYSLFWVLISPRLPDPQYGLAHLVPGAFYIGLAGIGIFVATNKKVSKWFF
ncbi:hypothetical protein JW824_13685 [bacterium]|nr:hypothetical protein [bacterium]